MREHVHVDPARLAAFELFSSADLTSSVQIQPCRECEPWFVEAQPHADHVLVREWHDEKCPHLRTLLAEDRADADGPGPGSCDARLDERLDRAD